MHTIKLKVEDSIYEHIIFLLNNIKSNKLEIIEDKTESNNNSKKQFTAVALNTKNYTFNREEANER